MNGNVHLFERLPKVAQAAEAGAPAAAAAVARAQAAGGGDPQRPQPSQSRPAAAIVGRTCRTDRRPAEIALANCPRSLPDLPRGRWISS